ncbi:MAG TPA: HAD family hydrolase [Candidatus Hydrogenedentes bacterium]|nr:HAD family hydrolase [Candidatus Hydrogenedentota bacterium]HRK34300.1 HAD family hydrolase [Candidatus Hydrogenedentota bacterium]
MAVRAITFDFWRTLFCEAREPVERRQLRTDAVSRAAGVAPEAAEKALHVAESDFLHHHVHQQQTLGPPDAVRIVERELGIRFDANTRLELAHIFGTAILSYPPEPIPHAVEAVRAAAERFPIGIISDAGISPGSSLRQLLDMHGMMPYFRVLAFSDEVGVSKPQTLMFETAARGLGVGLHELLHIGDLQATDIAGAQSIGSKAALFVGDNDRYRASTTADFILESWAHFVEWLPGFNPENG